MSKTILITGSTDGIGLETAKELVSQGHKLLIHGRNPSKLADVKALLAQIPHSKSVEVFVADLSSIQGVENLAKAVSSQHVQLDVLINNAGVYTVPSVTTADGLDVRFMVNTIAPYQLTQRLLPLFDGYGRIVNLSSAAQSSVKLASLAQSNDTAADGDIYAQSKLALTMWSAHLAHSLESKGPSIIAVNPGSFLGSKLVKEAYGVAGKDLSIGAEILCKAALSDEFAAVSGQYFDNDSGGFTRPHPDAMNPVKNQKVTDAINTILESKRTLRS